MAYNSKEQTTKIMKTCTTNERKPRKKKEGQIFQLKSMRKCGKNKKKCIILIIHKNYNNHFFSFCFFDGG